MCIADVTGQNPDKTFALLKIDFLKEISETRIHFPNKDETSQFYKQISAEIEDQKSLETDMDIHNFENILNKDSLAELTEQDKIFLWRHREKCLKFPNSLPRLLQCINWSCKREIAEVNKLPPHSGG